MSFLNMGFGILGVRLWLVDLEPAVNGCGS